MAVERALVGPYLFYVNETGVEDIFRIAVLATAVL